MAKTDTAPRKTSPRLPKSVSTIIRAARDKKATGIVVLDLRKAGGFTDYFVICTGQNPRQITAIADAVMESMRETMGDRPALVEGVQKSEDRKSTRLNSSHVSESRMPSSA